MFICNCRIHEDIASMRSRFPCYRFHWIYYQTCIHSYQQYHSWSMITQRKRISINKYNRLFLRALDIKYVYSVLHSSISKSTIIKYFIKFLIKVLKLSLTRSYIVPHIFHISYKLRTWLCMKNRFIVIKSRRFKSWSLICLINNIHILVLECLSVFILLTIFWIISIL